MYEIQHLSPDEVLPQLRELPQPPKRLSLRGTLPPDDHKLLCVVGSRRYSAYGKEVCEKIIGELAGHPISIISGLALGIDAIAHSAALDAGLHTLAIPGSGLNTNVLYPATNRGLARRILEAGGGLLSEFPDDTRAAPYTFPQRNRLMAGIALGIVVIEATERSGTLITARLGTEYNKDIFAVPHTIFSPSGAGPHRLLKHGAIPVTCGGDILEQWNLIEAETSNTASTIPQDCSPDERTILEHLTEPQSADDLIRIVGIPTHEVQIILSAMEIKGVIVERLGKIHRV